ncbi:GMC family oxidoreductase [Tistrella mobilis]|uniref:GMC family oxidoreductase n=1 Tax=Tistrella mobilis TaxID=171437 RepID=UPI003555CC92
MATRLPEKEIVVIGGGLTAGLVARKLVPAGREVLVLERGPDWSGSAVGELPHQRDELRWSTYRGMTRRETVETYTLRHSPDEDALPMRQLLSFLPGFGVGGAAQHWNGQTWRFSESDYVLRQHLTERYGAKSIPDGMTIQDWGLTYRDLQPYYEEFEALFGIAGKAGNLRGVRQAGGNPFEPWRATEYPLPPLEMSEASQIFKDATGQLGYEAFPLPAANASQPYRNPDGMQLGQCQYCGHCERFTCEANAKATPASLLFPLVRSRPNFELRAGAEVIRLNTTADGTRLESVSYVDVATGQEFIQPGSLFVLCSYTLSNVRLLLLSKIGTPYDPVTRTGTVGKNYCYQVTSGLNMFFPDRYINPFMGAGALGFVIDDFNNDNFDHTGLGFHGGGYISATQTNGRPIDTRRLPPGTPRWGSAWKKANADWYLRSMGLSVHGSNYANARNYMDLDPDYKDQWGRPLLRITFDFDDNDALMCRYVNGKMEEIAAAAGAKIVGKASVRKSPYDTRQYQSTHNTGGTIMGSDPGSSVVSPHLQSWDVENLFISGASVFPQNSGYNPTGPVGALGLRLAEDLLSYLSGPRRLG